MPNSHAAASPPLRASHALPLATLILLAILFGTPVRDDRQVARAQSPASPVMHLRRPAGEPRRLMPFPYPKRSAASTSRDKRPRRPRPRAPAASLAIKDNTTRTRNRKPSGLVASIVTAGTLKRPTSRRPTLAEVSGGVEKLGQPGPVVHALEP